MPSPVRVPFVRPPYPRVLPLPERVRVHPPRPFERYHFAGREPTLGQLGLTPTESQAASAVAGKGAAVGAASIASYAGAGAAAGPIGAAVGLIVGIVATKLLAKNYLNVPQMNAQEGNEIAVFNQYRPIMGQVPGRQLGLAAMTEVMKGALHSGYFHLNNEVQCFHEGCSAHPGNASLVDTVVSGNSIDNNTFNQLYPAFLASYRSGGPSAGGSTTVAARAGLAMRPGLHFAGFGRLGVLGATAAKPVPEAVSFIDHFFIPANSAPSPCRGHPCYWASPSNNLEHQILYDLADAYLAQQPIMTTPYVAAAPYPQPQAATAIRASATVIPRTALTPAVVSRPVAALPAQPIAPSVTVQVPPTAQPIAAAAKFVTSTGAATQANLDASLAAQGFNRLGTTPQGVPIYADPGGNSWLYQNGQMFPYGSVAQVASTGNAGTGIATPTTGLDPTTAGIIAASLAAGLTPAQAVQASIQYLTATGVPITPTVQAQLAAAAGIPAAPAAGFTVSPLMLGAGALVLLWVLK